MRRFAWAAAAIVLIALILGRQLVPTSRPPNIVLIVADDQHPASVETMPELLRLAEHGTVFRNAFATTPICAPARATLLTGHYPVTHGVIANLLFDSERNPSNGAFAFDDSDTIGTRLHDAGYRTGFMGKYMNGYTYLSPKVPPGWDRWRVFVEDVKVFYDYTLNEDGKHVGYGSEATDYSTDVLTRHAVDFIDEGGEQPFLLIVAPFSPHDPSTPAPRHLRIAEDMPAWRPPSWSEADLSDKPGWFRILTKSVGEEGIAKRMIKRKKQIRSLRSVDEMIASILQALERNGRRDDTIVIYTADHGLSWGEHRWTGKQLAYEECIRIPLVMRFPGREPAVHDELVLNLDIAPTIAELAGVGRAKSVEGKSLAPLIHQEDAAWRQEIGLRHFKGGFLIPPWEAVRTARYKFIRSHGFVELYDLERDRFEIESVANDPSYAQIREILEERATRLREDPNDTSGPDVYPLPVAGQPAAG